MKSERIRLFVSLTLCALLSLACSLGGLPGSAEVPTTQPTVDLDQSAPANPSPEPIAQLTAIESGAPTYLEGTYFFNRIDPDGTTKNGSLDIGTWEAGYVLSWSDNIGLALKSESTLAVGAGEDCGVVVYEILPDKSMTGVWMGWGGDQGLESLEPTTAMLGNDLSGVYAAEGYNPDGSAYGGTLTIDPLGSIYSLFWETGSGANTADFTGIGLAQDNRLAAAYGEDHCIVYLYQLQPDGGLEGIIGYPDGSTGSETAGQN
jgi:hypothetical protein